MTLSKVVSGNCVSRLIENYFLNYPFKIKALLTCDHMKRKSLDTLEILCVVAYGIFPSTRDGDIYNVCYL